MCLCEETFLLSWVVTDVLIPALRMLAGMKKFLSSQDSLCMELPWVHGLPQNYVGSNFQTT